MLNPSNWGQGSFGGAIQGANDGCWHTFPPAGTLGGFVYRKKPEGGGCLNKHALRGARQSGTWWVGNFRELEKAGKGAAAGKTVESCPEELFAASRSTTQ